MNDYKFFKNQGLGVYKKQVVPYYPLAICQKPTISDNGILTAFARGVPP